jgi:hypothetical protein
LIAISRSETTISRRFTPRNGNQYYRIFTELLFDLYYFPEVLNIQAASARKTKDATALIQTGISCEPAITGTFMIKRIACAIAIKRKIAPAVFNAVFFIFFSLFELSG